MAEQNDDPSTTSADYEIMLSYWRMVEAIKGGAEAMRAVAQGGQTYSSMSGPSQPVANLRDLQRGLGPTYPQSPYLPAFPNESYADYEARRKWAPFANLYEDIADNLASKPFSKETTLADGTGSDIEQIAENIDGQGHSLHVFAKAMFRDGIDYGIDWCLVDYTKVNPGATLADERAINARPYWIRIPADRMLAVYSAFVNGEESIYHARIKEDAVYQTGYDEMLVERVRVLNRETVTDDLGNVLGLGPATWELWEKQENTNAGNKTIEWVLVAGGPITIGEIPLVPFIPIGRLGSSWKVRAPLHDIAYMQVEEFQQESNLKAIKEVTAFPMLAGNGVQPPQDTAGNPMSVPVGAKAVLFAPMSADGRHGQWDFIEPSGSSLTFLQQDLHHLREEMRALGRQPLADANLTVVTTANQSMKAHSAVQAWALMLQNALEQAFKFTNMWLKKPDQKTEVRVHTDFGVDFQADTELTSLLTAEAQGILSKRTVQDEFKRRGVLADDFDPDEEEKQLATEQEGQQLQPEKMIDPVTGQPIVATPKKGVPNPPPKPIAPAKAKVNWAS